MNLPENSAVNANPYVDFMSPNNNPYLFMGVLYFNDWAYFFPESDKKLEAFLAAYSQPSTILNWNTEQFITMIRRTGKGLLYMGRLPFGKEDSV